MRPQAYLLIGFSLLAFLSGCGGSSDRYGSVSDALIDIASLKVPQRATSGLVKDLVEAPFKKEDAIDSPAAPPSRHLLIPESFDCEGKTPNPRPERALVLLIDKSKSMASLPNGKETVQTLAKEAYASLKKEDFYGITAVDQTPWRVVQLSKVAHISEQQLNERAERIYFRGRTNVLAGLLDAMGVVACSQAHEKSVVFFTDVTLPLENPSQELAALSRLRREYGIKIWFALPIVPNGDTGFVVAPALSEGPETPRTELDRKLLSHVTKLGLKLYFLKVSSDEVSAPSSAPISDSEVVSLGTATTLRATQIRDTPGYAASVVASLPKAATVAVTATSGEWAVIRSVKGKIGYLPLADLSKVQP
jgi:hypothetical protein